MRRVLVCGVRCLVFAMAFGAEWRANHFILARFVVLSFENDAASPGPDSCPTLGFLVRCRSCQIRVRSGTCPIEFAVVIGFPLPEPGPNSGLGEKKRKECRHTGHPLLPKCKTRGLRARTSVAKDR